MAQHDRVVAPFERPVTTILTAETGEPIEARIEHRLKVRAPPLEDHLRDAAMRADPDIVDEERRLGRFKVYSGDHERGVMKAVD